MLDQQDLDDKYDELDKLALERIAVEAELNTILSEYQVFSSCEFANWVGKLKASGLDIKTAVKAEYTKDMPLEQRIEAIRQIIEAGRDLAKEVWGLRNPSTALSSLSTIRRCQKRVTQCNSPRKKLLKKRLRGLRLKHSTMHSTTGRANTAQTLKKVMEYLQRSLKPIEGSAVNRRFCPRSSAPIHQKCWITLNMRTD